MGCIENLSCPSSILTPKLMKIYRIKSCDIYLQAEFAILIGTCSIPGYAKKISGSIFLLRGLICIIKGTDIVWLLLCE